ncbi:MAG: NAD(+)/NADH kinase [Campylobacterota bacterium]
MQLQTVGCTLRPSSPELKRAFFNVKELFEKENIEVLIDDISAGMIGVYGTSFERMCRQSDMLLALGGDGTLISLVRRSYNFNKPVLGVNAGNLCFLSDVSSLEMKQFLQDILADNIRIDKRMMIEGVIHKQNGEPEHFVSFNDVVVSRPSISHMATVEAFVDDKNFNTYHGDGLIVSTPSGSTAYNLACGGPVVYPLTHAFILTPISPHSLTQRPLVMPADFSIKLRSAEQVLIIVDGQERYSLYAGDEVILTLAPRDARLIHRIERNYFDVLRQKLSWGGE